MTIRDGTGAVPYVDTIIVSVVSVRLMDKTVPYADTIIACRGDPLWSPVVVPPCPPAWARYSPLTSDVSPP